MGSLLLILPQLAFPTGSPTGLGTHWENTYFHLGADAGLQGDLVYAIYKDRKGYLWFCTDMGVSRYDGYNFHNYSTSDGITDNDIFGAVEDSRGRLWLMARSGIPCFYYKGAFHNPKTDPYLGAMAGKNFASAFYEDAHKTVYLGYFDGATYSLDTLNRIHKYTCGELCRILGIGYNASLGVYAIQNINQLQSLSRADGARKRVSEITISGSENYPLKFLQMPGGVSLMSWGQKVRVMDNSCRLYHREGIIPEGKILGLSLGSHNKIHVATTHGAYCFTDTSFAHMGEPPVLTGHEIYAILEDSSSGYWYGTDHGAYFRPNIACRKLISAAETPCSPTALVRLGNGHVLAGFDDGQILEFDQQLSLLKQESIAPAAIKSFHLRDSSEVWIRTGSGLYRRTPDELARIQNFNARSLDFAAGDPSRVVFCNSPGWTEVDARRYATFLFGDSLLQYPKPTGECQCYFVKYDAAHRLWVADASGIGVWSGSKRVDVPIVRDMIQYSFVSQILTARDGTVWFATAGNGLLAYRDGQVVRFSQANGLSSNFVTAVTEDPEGGIWVGTSKGLQLVNAVEPAADAMSNSQNTAIWFKNAKVQCLLVEDTRLFVGSDKSLFVFDKLGLLQAETVLAPQIELVSWGEGHASADSAVALPYELNSVQFDFLALSFLASGNIQYRYRMLGLSQEWSETAARFVRYPALEAGRFEFQVQARMQGGQWGTAMAKYAFEIVPPYWQTWWFITCAIVLVLGSITTILWLVLASVKRRNALINRTVIAEQKALITQMSPHFIFNSLNSIQNFFLTNDLENANDYLADFGSLIRLILENGRTSKITLDREILLLTLYIRLESLRLRNKFEFEILVDGLEEGRTCLPPMILQPFVENAIWHGIAPKQDRGRLSIRFARHGRCLQIMVEDNGVGRKRSAELRSVTGATHKSLATSITMERLEIMRKISPTQVSFQIIDLVDAEELGIGTCVSIRLPLEIQDHISTQL
jgi:ligand-binding sensor domain-containing protein